MGKRFPKYEQSHHLMLPKKPVETNSPAKELTNELDIYYFLRQLLRLESCVKLLSS